jgi:hypothetical protein
MIEILTAFMLAQAQPCGPTGSVERRIHTQYGETIVGAGVVQANGGYLFITANPATGTWTAMLRRNGQTCVMTSGSGWASQDAVVLGVPT